MASLICSFSLWQHVRLSRSVPEVDFVCCWDMIKQPIVVCVWRLMVTVTHSVPSSLGSSGRNVRFLHAAFDKAGDCFVAGDHHGNVFAFDLVKNRLVDLCRMVCWQWK